MDLSPPMHKEEWVYMALAFIKKCTTERNGTKK